MFQAAFSGVLERLYLNGSNTYSKEQVFEGEVCHEETIGDYSSYININNGRGDLGGAPYYAYSMIDTDLLLLPSLAHYFLELPQGKDRAYWFLMRTSSLDTTKGRTYYDLLHLNVKFVMDTSQPFADNPSVDNLRHLKPGEPVGSWRDSSTGLGNGRIPFDVNVGLVPGCLRAIASLAKAGILDKSLEDTANRYATVWEQRASGFFEVKMPIEQAFSHILNYTQWANLTADLNYGEGAFNDSSFAVQGAAPTAPNTAHGWLSNDDTDHMFYALSLFNDSTPVQTLHSDIGAPLLYANNISERYMKAIADALLPFPKGLLTPIGPVVANPAMDANINDYSLFDRAQYHGSVVWGFQNAILASGLIRQLSFCGSYLDSSLPFVDVYTQPAAIPPWCMNKELVGALLAGLDRLWRGFEGAGKNIYSEVWSYSYINKNCGAMGF
uniref:Uncharacterized protein n=1 Tax=Plectus sambesii TaxID=2011161 RepID=A0A914W4R6_9BILA